MNDKSRSPVQSSAVVSRDGTRLDDILSGFREHPHVRASDMGDTSVLQDMIDWRNEKIELLEDAIRHHQPAAPVQSGGVDLSLFAKTVQSIVGPLTWNKQPYLSTEATERIVALLDHLTTTQSAPVAEGRRSLGWLVQNWAEANKVIIGPHTAVSLADALAENGYTHPEAPDADIAPSGKVE